MLTWTTDRPPFEVTTWPVEVQFRSVSGDSSNAGTSAISGLLPSQRLNQLHDARRKKGS